MRAGRLLGTKHPDAVCREQADLFVRNLRLSLPINCLLALSAVALIYQSETSTQLLLWAGAIITLNMVRYVATQPRSTARHGVTRPAVLLKFCTLSALLSGLLWAVLPVYFIDYTGYQAPFVSIILCGLTAGAAIQGNAFAAPVLAIAIPILGAMTVKVALLGTQNGIILAVDLILYLVIIVRSSLAAEVTFVNSVLVRNEARALSRSLELEHAASQAAAARYFELANHDPLTGVANRAFFSAELAAWLQTARETNGAFSLFLIDLDHFKSINDTLGHSVGDTVLCEVARRLAGELDPGHLLARLGGDEFAVLARAGAPGDDRNAIAKRILQAASGPLAAGGEIVDVGLSIGVSSFPQDGADAEELLVRADLALYAAKAAGRQGWRCFERSMLLVAEFDRDIERDLPAALADGSIEVWWQPQVEIDSGDLVGLEGLLRWRHPLHGWIAQPLAAAAALKSRRSAALTGFVLGKACAMIARLASERRGDVVVAVNISPSEIGHYDLPALVRRAIEAAAVDPSRLELAITEEAILSDGKAVTALREVAGTGVRLAINRFGTGSASLVYLRGLRVDRLKIDGGFVAGLVEREGDRTLVQAILGIGRSLGVEVVAEGVERVEDALTLRALGCRIAQGRHFGEAMPAEALRPFIDTRPRPSPSDLSRHRAA